MADSFDRAPSGHDADWTTTTTILDGLGEYQNARAWDRFVQRFRRPIVHFVARIGVPDPASEDVAQDTLMAFGEAFREGRYDRQKGRLSSWLFGIAYRQAQAHRRMLARNPSAASREADVEWLDQPTASEAWNQIWQKFVLERSLAQARLEFSDQTYLAFQYVALEDRSTEETAQLLNTSVKSVYNAKHRVLSRVRILMNHIESVKS